MAEVTYFGFSAPVVWPVDDEGKVEGSDLYVYGSVVAVGRLMNGDTVKGT